MNKKLLYTGILSTLIFGACSYDEFGTPDANPGGLSKINLSGQITQEYNTRANDDGFADGDVMGVYIVDYEANNPGTLLTKGNRGDNVRHTFIESSYSWSSAYDVYWKDKHTRIDVYGYYPFGSPEDVNNYQFTVKTNQANMPSDGTMGDYEASDFLWGKVPGVEPTNNVIRLPMAHKMANARVTLIEGSGFADGEWNNLKKQVLVTNTIQDCSIDLATGIVTPTGDVAIKSIIPAQKNDEWRAIVVPQTIPASTQMFSITIDGIPYKFSKSEEFTYIAGKMNNFGIKVDKKESTGAYSLTLISESITAWENDLVSHDATAKEYIVINSTPGQLKNAITAAQKDYTKLRNLKITGSINAQDFNFMKSEMQELAALNLKEVRVSNDEIPRDAMADKKTLISLVLPDRLKLIGMSAFGRCTNLAGSLIIPEGVEYIGNEAFDHCVNLTGSLSLPSTLKEIDDRAFFYNRFTCELSLPDNLERIGSEAFAQCRGFYGALRLPEKLKKLEFQAFSGCDNLSSNLEIPQGVTIIPEGCFSGCWLGGTLTLHDGITAIEDRAFEGNGFKGELTLPKDLEVIGESVFYNNSFSGNLVLPKGLRTIGYQAFAYNWRLTGILEIPENVITIGAGAFAHCRDLEGVIFPEGLENIKYEASFGESGGAFQNCYGIGKIVCKGELPPYVQTGAFDGVPKDNFTVEVPESAVASYQTAVGWCEFKRIAAHHELVCRPSVACAISSKHNQTLVIDAEGEWEVASKPDWCTLSQSSGFKKTEVTLTINEYPSSTGSREGDVVFRLKGKDYTHSCHVRQFGYEYKEDQFITLQKASKRNRGGINIVIIGDGYDAKEIADGSYLKDMREEMEYFFGIEPYTTYRNYFNVYTAIALSTESGVGSINTIRYNRFNTTYTGGVGLKCDYDDIFNYALNAPTLNSDNLNESLIIVIPNSTDYGGICQLWTSGAAIAFCPKSDFGYPLDSRGVIQHEAGGHGFGKLGDEYIYHNAFIDFCGCTCCAHADVLAFGKALGWYENLELTGKMHQVGWSHLIFDPRYSDVVDIFEGGFMHSRGVFRSEQNSCMNNDIPYYSTISRESIVKRIKRYAGETYSFEEFVANDKKGAAAVTRSLDFGISTSNKQSFAPVIHEGSPLSSKKAKIKTFNHNHIHSH